MIRIGLLGSSGRMGTLITSLAQNEFKSDLEIIAMARKGDPLDPLLSADVIIDVSFPPVMTQLANLALKKGKDLPRFVVGSTGWSPEGLCLLEKLAGATPTLLSTNFSSGVFALSMMLKEYAPLFKKMGYVPVMIEKHHIHKKDAPSGTARTLQGSIDPVHPAQVQTHSVRAGEVIGDHEVTFYGAGDQITLSHHAQDRTIFARGAIETARWLATAKTSSHSHRILGMSDYFESLKTNSLGVS